MKLSISYEHMPRWQTVCMVSGASIAPYFLIGGLGETLVRHSCNAENCSKEQQERVFSRCWLWKNSDCLKWPLIALALTSTTAAGWGLGKRAFTKLKP